MNFSIIGQKTLLIKTWNGIIKINASDIIFVKADMQGIMITLTDGRNYECPISLAEIAKSLIKFPFFRIHRKYLINIKYVTEYMNNKEMVRLVFSCYTFDLPVSRRNKKFFIEAWKELSIMVQEI